MKKHNLDLRQRSVVRAWPGKIICVLWVCVLVAAQPARAQQNDTIVALTKEIMDAKTQESLAKSFEALTSQYAQSRKYSDCVEFLRSLAQKKQSLDVFVNYYIAFIRYQQLKYLEETLAWDEYFSQGNIYREDIMASAQKAVEASSPNDPLRVYSRLVLWQFHYDQQDAFHEQALVELMNDTGAYAQGAQDMLPVRKTADALLSYGQKGKSRELYKVYVEKTIGTVTKADELLAAAQDFYKQKNIELSELMFDAYFTRIANVMPKEEAIPLLRKIASLFAYATQEGIQDLLYAESVFEKIAVIGGKDIFDAELLYARALNIEKVKEYALARTYYEELVRRYPDSPHVDEACFKLGALYLYASRDLKSGKEYLQKAAQKEAGNPYCLASLYQLGLLSQWEEEYDAAKKYYADFLEKAKGDFPQTQSLINERMKEMEGLKPLEYNLKTFLDTSLKQGYENFEMNKLELKALPQTAGKDHLVAVSAMPFLSESGCMQVSVEYLWSGNLGKELPASDQASFQTSYNELGPKLINAVAVTASGIIDRNFAIIDIN
jgi:TolA-binding protein